MSLSLKIRTLLLTSFLFVIASNNAFAEANKVVVIPMAADSVPVQALAQAYGYIRVQSISGVQTPSVVTGYNVGTVTRLSTGVYNITLTIDFAGEPVVLVTSFNTSSDTEIATYNFTDPNIVTIRVVGENNAAVETNFSFVVYGTTQ